MAAAAASCCLLPRPDVCSTRDVRNGRTELGLFTSFPSLIKSTGDASSGEQLHAVAVKRGFTVDSFTLNALVSMYGRCGLVEEARQVFDAMPEEHKQRSAVPWNCLLSALSRNGRVEAGVGLLVQSLAAAVVPDEATLVTALPMCGLRMGRTVHGAGVKLGLDSSVRMSSALVELYSDCGEVDDAERVFSSGRQRWPVSGWNAMLGAYARRSHGRLALDLLRQMLLEKGGAWFADEITVLAVLPACSKLREVEQLHAFLVKNALAPLDNAALLAAYARCGSLECAARVFSKAELKSVRLWNAHMGGWTQNGEPSKAVELFLEMELEPDSFTIASLLLACSRLKHLRHGKAAHGFVIRKGMDRDPFLANSLLSMYVQCEMEMAARRVFDRDDEVSWNTMIAGYSQNGRPDESLALFRELMHIKLQERNSKIASAAALAACAQASAVRLGKELHGHALRAGYAEDTAVGTAIVDMYAKCGYIEEASAWFRLQDAEKRDTGAWSAMMIGYAANGLAGDAMRLYGEMQREGVSPDECTYIGLLMACCHAGAVEQGLTYLEEMQRVHGLEPQVQHYACALDMLGRAGRLAEAAALLEAMPVDGAMLSSVLGACRVQGNVEVGERIAGELMRMEPEKAEHYVLWANLYAERRRWDDARRVRKKMEEGGLRKDAGCSWIHVLGKLHAFVAAGPRLHQDQPWVVLLHTLARDMMTRAHTDADLEQEMMMAGDAST